MQSDLGEEAERLLTELIEAYPQPITDLPKTRTLWAALSSAERAEALVGAKGYAAFVAGERQRGRNRVVKDAHNWLRNRQWIGYLPQGRQVEALASRTDVAEGSPEWSARRGCLCTKGRASSPPGSVACANCRTSTSARAASSSTGLTRRPCWCQPNGRRRKEPPARRRRREGKDSAKPNREAEGAEC
jgi:hypothetical protein